MVKREDHFIYPVMVQRRTKSVQTGYTKGVKCKIQRNLSMMFDGVLIGKYPTQKTGKIFVLIIRRGDMKVRLPEDIENKQCVKCGTSKLLNEYDEAYCDDSRNYICHMCLYGGDKTWKFRMTPHPDGDHGRMVTDDFEDIKDGVENMEDDEGEYTIEIDYGYESIELYVDRILDEKEGVA